jgi:sarcosine oxidase subunit gamma
VAVSTPWLRELPAAARFVFQGGAAAQSAAGALWGTPLPENACRATSHGTRAALWLGPDEFLLWDAEASSADRASAFLKLQQDHPCSVVDVSHRQVGWEIYGRFAETILSGACPLDLDVEHFPVGMCTRTVLAKAEILLWRREPEIFHLEAWRSFAPYVTALLAEIACGYPLS